MDEPSLLAAHLRDALGLTVEELERLPVTAWNRHYRVVFGGRERHLVAYHLPPELPMMGLRFEHAVIRLLLARGYREVPEVHVHGGESLFRAGDTIYSISEWIEGCHDQPERPVTPGELADAARALARLHAATAGAELRLDYFPEHVFVYPAGDFLDRWPALLARQEARVAADEGGAYGAAGREALADLLPMARSFLAGFPRPLYDRVRAADPTGVVHGDYRRMNLVFRDDRVVRVLDYNCCFNDVRLWDVAYAALSMAGKETVGPVTDPPMASAFVRAYHAVSPLSADERALLPHLLTFVLVKLATSAWDAGWLLDRVGSVRLLLDGGAERIANESFTDLGASA